jgi:hypothetical protein
MMRMRTTIDLDDEVHAAATAAARAQGITLGQILSEAWRNATRAGSRVRRRNGILVLEGGAGITPQTTREVLSEVD